MPDDRLFHIRLGQSEKVDKLTDFERNVWMIYVLAADDFGVMRFSPVTLQEHARFLERRPRKVVERALETVRDVGLIHTFEHQGRTYAYQQDWQSWQKVRYPSRTIHPTPPAAACDANTQWLLQFHPGGLKLASWKPPEVVPEHSGKIPGKVPETVRTNSAPSLAVSQSSLVSDRQSLVPPPADARSKRPIFKGQSFVVFEWMLDDLRRMLGSHTEAFDLHAWFFDLDGKAAAAQVVVPQRDGGKWLQEQTLAEAVRRGLPVAATAQGTGKTAGNSAAAHRFIARGAQ